jgi:hypothetical protein
LFCRFYAKGTFQIDIGDTANITQPSVSRCIAAVTRIIVSIAPSYIHFPDTDEEIRRNKHQFYQLKRFPNVLGLIDGTHIKIAPPLGDDEKLYVCRKGGHSINVQIVCDAKMRIIDLVSKWPGATNDAFIFANCGLKDDLTVNRHGGYLLGKHRLKNVL